MPKSSELSGMPEQSALKEGREAVFTGKEMQLESDPSTELQDMLNAIARPSRDETDARSTGGVGSTYFYGMGNFRYSVELYGYDKYGKMHVFGVPEKNAQERGYNGVFYFGAVDLNPGQSIRDFHFSPGDALTKTSLEVARLVPEKKDG